MKSTQILFFADPMVETSAQDERGDEKCIPNISLAESRKRIWFATRLFLLTLVVLIVLLAIDVPLLWRLSLFFPFSASTTSYIQALDKT